MAYSEAEQAIRERWPGHDAAYVASRFFKWLNHKNTWLDNLDRLAFDREWNRYVLSQMASLH